MKPKKIVILPGDGIGPEVVAVTQEIIEWVCNHYDLPVEYETLPFGGASIDQYGVPLTDEVFEKCKNSDAIFMGAVGGPKWENLPPDRNPEAGILKLRKSLDLFANLRPAQVYPSLLNYSSVKPDFLNGTDFVVVRELTGGLYFGNPRGMTEDKAWNTLTYNAKEVDRIARVAFQLASKRYRKTLTHVDKANVLEASKFWRSRVNAIAKEFPDVTVNHMLVDNAAMQIVRNPKQFDVILTENLFGDVLSDISGAITGSLGMLPSASLGNQNALYEPIHGSAPDIAGKNIANPIGTIESAALMFLHSFDRHDIYIQIRSAVRVALEKGYRTADLDPEKLGSTITTKQMGSAILDQLKIICESEDWKG